jgi:hypothetical protein
MDRIVQPELLDHLPADDPRAVRSRNDLRRVNWFMANAAIISSALRKHFGAGAPRRLVELGAGDGTLLLAIARRLPGAPGIEAVLVDQQPVVSTETLDGFAQMGWKVSIVQSDVFAWLARGEASDCLLANLFLHHFSREQLPILFAAAAEQTGCFIASEPRRIRFAGIARRLLWLIRCNEVTQHDGEISVRAGFRDRELSGYWKARGWQCEEREAGLFSHLFVAKKL